MAKKTEAASEADAKAARQALEKIRRLHTLRLTLIAEYHEKLEAIDGEVDAILGGKPTIGLLLKRLYEAFDAAWCVRYAPGGKNQYRWNFVHDTPQLKKLLKQFGVEELELRMIAYVKDGEAFYAKERHPFSLFVRNINRFIGEGRDAAEIELSTGLELCIREGKHQPPCKSDQEHTKKRAQEMRT